MNIITGDLTRTTSNKLIKGHKNNVSPWANADRSAGDNTTEILGTHSSKHDLHTYGKNTSSKVNMRDYGKELEREDYGGYQYTKEGDSSNMKVIDTNRSSHRYNSRNDVIGDNYT